MDNDSETKFYFEIKNNPFRWTPRKIAPKIEKKFQDLQEK